MISPGYPEKRRRRPEAGESCFNCVSSALASIVHTLPTPQTSISHKRQVANSLQDLRPVSCDRKGPRRPSPVLSQKVVLASDRLLPMVVGSGTPGLDDQTKSEVAIPQHPSLLLYTKTFTASLRDCHRWADDRGRHIRDSFCLPCLSPRAFVYARGPRQPPSFALQHQAAMGACGLPPMAVWK